MRRGLIVPALGMTVLGGLASVTGLGGQEKKEAMPAQNGHPERRDDKSSSHSFSPPRMFCRVSPPMVLAAGEIIPKDAAFRRPRISVSSARNGGGCHGGPDRTAIGGPGVARAMQISKRSLRPRDSRAGAPLGRHAGLLAQG